MVIPLVLDFETYYDKDFSLSKMPTAQYVRDPRCEVLGAAIAPLGCPAVWIPGERLTATLAALDWSQVLLIAHNAAFDGLVLTEKYSHRPQAYRCTMLMARYLVSQGLLDPEQRTALEALAPLVGMEKGDLDASLASGTLDDYATLDADICAALYDLFTPQVPAFELDVMDTHVRMAAEPVFHLDRPRLQRMADADKALEDIFPLVRKDDAFGAALDALGVPPRYKTTAKGTYKLATAKTDGWLDTLVDHDDPRVRFLVSARQKASSTIERTRSQRFLDIGSPLPAPLLYYGTHTGRAAGEDKINVQNLKRDGDLRGAIMAPPGHKFVTVDSSQVEVRVLAWLAGQEDLLEAFRNGEDPYVMFAAQNLYYVPPGAVTTEQRRVGKAAVLSLGFAQGDRGFVLKCAKDRVPMDEPTAKRIVRAYRTAFAAIREYWYATERELRREGHLILPSGRCLTYPDLREGDDGLEFRRASIFRRAKSEGFANLWHGGLTENRVQAAARDLVFAQTLRLKRKGYHIALMVHDETVLLVQDKDAERAAEDARVAFASTPRFMPGLPVAGEVTISERYRK